MTVQELINELQNLDPQTPVLLSEDQEGNGYRYLECVSESAYNGAQQYSDLEVGIRAEHLPALRSQGYSEEDVLPINCITLY
jgi:hypothetical protein